MNNLFRRTILPILLTFMLVYGAKGQEKLNYFLPDGSYNNSIPTPESFLGFQIGEWHLHHAPLVYYFKELARVSDRAIVYEYARSYENRPLIQMVITSEKNHERLDEIRLQHLALTDPDRSGGLDVASMPVVVMMGYGVHGNEPSAHNAAPLVAYYLTASMDDAVLRMLDNTIIIIDPSLNPDGQDRFASWVNRHRSHTLVSDPADREFSDVWPGGRSNHYWFDLNRDWLGAQHPEINGKIKQFHHWKPNINTDHHEFGANSTFFFQPGVPTRVNPLTPPETNRLTYDIAAYHAGMLDQIGSLYYMEQGFDDFYYGKGSAYPDAYGSIGILFEQGGTKGHLRETVHGVNSFAFTIRNQVQVSLSTLAAAQDLRIPLLEHLRWFNKSALELAAKDPVKAYVFGDPFDNGRNYHFLDVLHTHQIEAYPLKESTDFQGKRFEAGSSWIVPLRQANYRFIKSLFETVTEFEDSLFYDVSTWTLPLAFQMPHMPLTSERQVQALIQTESTRAVFPKGLVLEGEDVYAWVFSWEEYYAPRALYHLQKEGIRTKVATRPFTITHDGRKIDMDFGSILVHVQTQDHSPERIRELLEEAAQISGIVVYPVATGLTASGIHLGSGGFSNIEKPSVLLLVGSGVTSSEAGEVWHLLDQRYRMPVTKVEAAGFRGLNLNRYSVIVMVSGTYGSLDDAAAEALRAWLRQGGTLVAIRSANNWLNRQKITEISYRNHTLRHPEKLPYESMSEYRGARSIPGSIFRSSLDLTHPLGYGYKRPELPFFVSGFSAANPAASPFSNPLLFSRNALWSGYAYKPYSELMNGSAGIITSSLGRGTIVSFMDNPNYRAYWFGTNKLFANAIFFGSIIRN